MLSKPRTINIDGVDIITGLMPADIAAACRLYEIKMFSGQPVVAIDSEGLKITIPLEEYNDLIETRGRYYETKDGEVESESLYEEYKELLVIKGKYEELSAMFDNQQVNDYTPAHGIVPGVMLCKDERVPAPDDNGNGSCRGM